MKDSRFFRICFGIIALLLIVYLTSKVSFLFHPLAVMVNVLIVPFMIAGFFYYLLRPVVRYLVQRRVNKMVAILVLYTALGAIAVLVSMYVWPTLQMQMENFATNAPALIEGFKLQIEEVQNSRLLSSFFSDSSQLSTKLSDVLGEGLNAASSYVTDILSFLTSFFIVVATVPIILYYILKQGHEMPTVVLPLIPRRYRKDGQEVLRDIDDALSGFIVGRVIITVLLGVLMYIGFLIIGLPYSLLLTVVSTVLNIIPYIGPILGAIPCVIVGFIESPTLAFWTLVVVLIAQQVEGNLLAPHIYGRRLDIHPLTTIVILLVAGDIAGILGVILAIPAYLVAKIILVKVYQLFFAEKVEELVE